MDPVCTWGEADVEAERRELGDEPAPLPVVAETVGEVVGAQVLVRDEFVQDVPGGKRGWNGPRRQWRA